MRFANRYDILGAIWGKNQKQNKLRKAEDQERKKKIGLFGKSQKTNDSKTKKIGAGLVFVGTLVLIAAIIVHIRQMAPASLSGFYRRKTRLGLLNEHREQNTAWQYINLLKDHEQYKLENIKICTTT